nr:MAG TPA: hypothetical protein [Caudoviricetes sp.]
MVGGSNVSRETRGMFHVKHSPSLHRNITAPYRTSGRGQ